MKRILHYSVLLLMIAFFTACSEEEEDPRGELTVTVKNASGAVQSGATVQLLTQDDYDVVDTKTTNSSGKATLEFAEAGLFSVLATKGSESGGNNISNVMLVGDSYTVTVTID